jgi:hypothetical protein
MCGCTPTRLFVPMHDNRRYVKFEGERAEPLLLRLLPLVLALFALTAVDARAEAVAPVSIEGALDAGRTPRVAHVSGRELVLSTRTDCGSSSCSWTSASIGRLPDGAGRAAGFRGDAIVVESREGRWLLLVARRSGRWRAVTVARAPSGGRLGPAGLTLSRRGLPVVAYALQRRDASTELWLVQQRRDGTLARTRITRRGFPVSRVPPAAAPVLMPNGTVRVVQTFSQRGANALFWRRERNRWWGRVLFASALGSSTLPLHPALNGSELQLAWTISYKTQQELHAVLTSRGARSRSVVVHRNAAAAGLVVGPNGPELAANEDVGGLPAGLVLLPAIITIAPSPPVELDGRIVAYARDTLGRRQLLLARPGGLEWFASAEVPHVRIFHEGGLSGRVEGAASGVVRVYRERPGEPRVLVAEAAVGADGRFSAADPAPVSGWHYRFVFEREFPYSLLVRTPIP